MNASTVADVLLIGAAVAWVLARQVQVARVKPRLLVLAPLVLAFFGIRRRDRHRVLPDHREERLQVKGHRPQRVRAAPARHELQIPVHQPVTQPVTDLARPRHETHKTRKAAHFSSFRGLSS